MTLFQKQMRQDDDWGVPSTEYKWGGIFTMLNRVKLDWLGPTVQWGLHNLVQLA